MNPLILNSLQIILSFLLIASILLQHRGTGLGGAFGGTSNVYRSKRGVEKVLFNASIIFAILFVTVAILNITLR
ncbi:preprotein translocase subunit SecG [Candidatus Berkelbacteria bacterium]|nr:preprotein translocase subunit SecG [Candidatus Berkelbacteria bacterium]